MTKIDKATAIQLAESKFWEGMTAQEIALFQMSTDALCMPFEVFHKAVKEALDRPVWIHEFALNRGGLMAELHGENSPPTMEDIINLIPEEKRIVVTGPREA